MVLGRARLGEGGAVGLALHLEARLGEDGAGGLALALRARLEEGGAGGFPLTLSEPQTRVTIVNI